MGQGIVGFLRGIVDHIERRAYLRRMQRLDDHLLADIGMRRDQLDIIILHPQMARIRTAAFAPRRAEPVPVLKGCV